MPSIIAYIIVSTNLFCLISKVEPFVQAKSKKQAKRKNREIFLTLSFFTFYA